MLLNLPSAHNSHAGELHVPKSGNTWNHVQCSQEILKFTHGLGSCVVCAYVPSIID